MAVLTEIRLRDFRCFESVHWQPSHGFNFLVGPNAQGKTSLLEAVCCLLRLQSPRTHRLQEIVRDGCPGFAVTGRVNETKLHFRHEAGGRMLAVDDVPQPRSSSYLRNGRVAWFANDHMQLVQGASASRRKFLDFLAAQIDSAYLRHLRAYERALRSRNLLLKEGTHRHRELAAYDGPLIEHGVELLQARRALFDDLRPLAKTACGEISGMDEEFDFVYAPGTSDDFASALEESKQEETRLRQTLVGPHRDDILLTIRKREAASFASEGQQRTLVLGLKLAQSRLLKQRTGEDPVFLLDDIFGELDPPRRNRLLQSLPLSAQVLITTTHLGWMDSIQQGAVWKVGGEKGIDRALP